MVLRNRFKFFQGIPRGFFPTVVCGIRDIIPWSGDKCGIPCLHKNVPPVQPLISRSRATEKCTSHSHVTASRTKPHFSVPAQAGPAQKETKITTPTRRFGRPLRTATALHKNPQRTKMGNASYDVCKGVAASQKSRGPVVSVKSRARINVCRTEFISRGKCETPHKILVSRFRATEKCKSRSRTNTFRPWPHPIQVLIVPFSPVVTESRGISSRSRKGVPRNASSIARNHHVGALERCRVLHT